MQLTSAIVVNLIIFLGTIISGVNVAAASDQTEVRVAICAAGSVSDIQLVASHSDGYTIDVRGAVEQASAVDIFVDGQQKAHIVLSGTQTNYFTTLSVAPGQHIVEAYIYDHCSHQTLVSRSIVTVPDLPSVPGGVPHDKIGLLTTPTGFEVDHHPPAYYNVPGYSKAKVLIDQIVSGAKNYTLLIIGFALVIWALIKTVQGSLYKKFVSRSAQKKRAYTRQQRLVLLMVVCGCTCIVAGLLLMV